MNFLPNISYPEDCPPLSLDLAIRRSRRNGGGDRRKFFTRSIELSSVSDASHGRAMFDGMHTHTINVWNSFTSSDNRLLCVSFVEDPPRG